MNSNHIEKIACVGSGVIGTSWALCFAQKGYEVTVYDIGEPQLATAKATMDSNLQFLLDNQIIDDTDVDVIKSRLSYTKDLAAAVKDAKFIQESGPENYDIKAAILSQIEAATAEDTIIASSTSGLLITEMAKKMKYPGRLVGGHPYNPPHLIPLVEIVKGTQSDLAAIQRAYDFYEAVGKEPVILRKEVTGYISNRLQVALYREAIDLVINGVCSLEDVDKACLYGPGIRWGIMGPNLIFHLGAGNAGLGTMLKRQRESTDIRLADLAEWKVLPQSFLDMADKGIAEEVAHRPPEKGRTIEELTAYRDKMLVELLRLHKKL